MAYWAAVQDYGSPELLRLAQAYLDQAEAMSGEDFPGLSARRRSLEVNVEAQQDMAHDTLRALFPGYRLLREGLVLFANQRYNTSAAALGSKQVHLTNAAVARPSNRKVRTF